MFEQLRKAIEMASGVAEIPRRQAERLARELASTGDLGRSQISAFAEEIVKRSRQNAEMLRSLVSSEVRRQIKALGLATTDDLERINRKIARIEARAEGTPASARAKTTAKKPSSRQKTTR